METLLEKSEKRKTRKERKTKPNLEAVCKNVSTDALETKLEIQLFPLFKRSMSAKHEKSTTYIQKAINGELNHLRIAKRVIEDYSTFKICIKNFVTLLENY